MSPPLTMSIASGPSETGPWVTNTTLASVASSNFAYFVAAVNRADHTWLKIQQTDGGTNRFRIDEITVGEASSSVRLQDFNAWTDPSFQTPGSYSRNGWNIQSASIALGGVSETRAALLSPPGGAVISPTYEGGIGEVRFWAKAQESGDTGFLLLQSTVDGGSNWTTRAAFNVTTANTFSAWLYLPSDQAQVRIVFDPLQNSGAVLVDNVEIRLPVIYRNQNFDGWPAKGNYASGVDSYQGWFITNCIVDGQNAYQGQVARLNTTVGNYILSPELPGGLGTISFRTRKWADSDAAFTLQVQVSPNGTSWTTLTNVSAASTIYESITIYLYDTTNQFVRLYHSAGAVRVLVDDIRIAIPSPRPEVIVTPSLDPANPIVDEPMTVLADVISRYGASVLSVTGYYRLGFGSYTPVAMAPVGFGSYAAVSDIPGLPAGAMVRYYVQVRYAGIGAAPGSSTYTTNTATTTVRTNFISTVSQGSVWINEIFYAPYDDEWEQDHEFIEICGREGVDIGGWTIQLAFGSSGDIANNGGQPVYASYTIPTNTVFTNMTNGFSFYVLGDQQLLDNSELVNQVLTTYVPTNVNPFSIGDRDHIYDGSTGVGVVRLLNQFNNLVYSLSYNGYAPGSERIPQTQDYFGETNSIILAGPGSTYDDFEWQMADLTIGYLNPGQTLQEPPENTNVFAHAWHTQALEITPVNTNDVPAFHMFDPARGGHFEDLHVYYGYTNAAYPNTYGILYHREGGIDAVWAMEPMDIRDGSLDADGHAYAFGTIPAYTYRRLQTIEYFIWVAPNQSGISPVFIGADEDDLNLTTVYTNQAGAEAHPFTYLVPIADPIVVTNFVVSSSNVVFQTDGNDPIDPLVTFAIRTTTNLLTPTQAWQTNVVSFTAVSNIYGQFTFTIQQAPTNRPKLFYRINPLWP
jgi:hypothetical protein